jgi:hypothetical protein
MHGDDDTDPDVIGVQRGPCRESFDAGRAYAKRQIQQSQDALRESNEELAAFCKRAKDSLVREEESQKPDPTLLRMMRNTVESLCSK